MTNVIRKIPIDVLPAARHIQHGVNHVTYARRRFRESK